MNIALEKWEKIDYDKVLEGIAAIVYVHNERDKNCIVDMRDRKMAVDNGTGYPWYKGAFGNALISLLHSQVTDKLYLIGTETLKRMLWSRTRTSKETLENEAIHTIIRKDV